MIRVFNEELSDFTNLVLVQPNNGWTGANGVVTGTALSAILTGDGTYLSPYMLCAQTAPVVGHKYYIRAKGKVTNSVCSAMRVLYGGVASPFATSPVINTVYDGSAVITAISTDPNSYVLQVYADAATANGKVMEVLGLIIIDLTAKYGAGNEHTSATMDKIKPLWALAYAGGDGTFTASLCVNDFETNGEKVIQPITCLEILQDNVDWRVELTADLSYVSFLKQDYIIVVNTKENGEQPFRINNVKVDNYEVYFSARHIGYDLNNYICGMPFGFVWTSGIVYVLRKILMMSLPHTPFSFSSDNFTSGRVVFKGNTILDNIYELVATLGGHLTFDWWNIDISETVGKDNGITVEYGKNLEGSEVVEDWNSVCTQIYPIGDNNLVLGTATNMIDATGVSYDRPYTRKVFFQTDDVVELEALANTYLELNKVPKLNYKVKANTVQDVGLGDTIYVYSKQFTISTNVLGYTYNPVTQRIVSIEFGNFRKDVKTVFSNITADINELKKSIVQENITMNNAISNIQENGAWTPTVGGTATYGAQAGTYVKDGNIVTIYCRLTISSIGTGSKISISGLPYPATDNYFSIAVGYYGSLTTAVSYLGGLIAGSSILLRSVLGTSGTSMGANNVLGNGSDLYISATYKTT